MIEIISYVYYIWNDNTYNKMYTRSELNNEVKSNFIKVNKIE
jgi:hypothetical protein